MMQCGHSAGEAVAARMEVVHERVGSEVGERTDHRPSPGCFGRGCMSSLGTPAKGVYR